MRPRITLIAAIGNKVSWVDQWHVLSHARSVTVSIIRSLHVCVGFCIKNEMLTVTFLIEHGSRVWSRYKCKRGPAGWSMWIRQQHQHVRQVGEYSDIGGGDRYGTVDSTVDIRYDVTVCFQSYLWNLNRISIAAPRWIPNFGYRRGRKNRCFRSYYQRKWTFLIISNLENCFRTPCTTVNSIRSRRLFSLLTIVCYFRQYWLAWQRPPSHNSGTALEPGWATARTATTQSHPALAHRLNTRPESTHIPARTTHTAATRPPHHKVERGTVDGTAVTMAVNGTAETKAAGTEETKAAGTATLSTVEHTLEMEITMARASKKPELTVTLARTGTVRWTNDHIKRDYSSILSVDNNGGWNGNNGGWNNGNNGQWNGNNGAWNGAQAGWNGGHQAAAQLPAGVDAGACPNYPYCH